MKRIYLDYASTTSLDKEVLEAMLPYFGLSSLTPNSELLNPRLFGNPGSLHSFGQEASGAVFKARRKIADILGVHYSTIVFTGSATEANNLVLQSLAKKNKKILVSSIEHESVLELAENSSTKAVKIPVLKSGQIDFKAFAKALDKNVALVSIIYANNEIGSFQDFKKITKLVKEKAPQALLHTDAVQAFQYLDCRPEELGVDFMTLSSHKIYGPKGIGLLYVNQSLGVRSKELGARGGDWLKPIIYGGGQEGGLRSGTENVASIVGFAKAIELADKLRKKETKRICDLRDWFLKELLKIFPKAKLNGQKRWRLPNNINLNLGGISNEEAMTFLDLNGVAVSAGSACSARSLEASKTLLAIGLSEKDAKSSIRITLGRQTKKEELKRALKVFKAMKKTLK